MGKNNLKEIHILRWDEIPDFPLYIDQVVSLIEQSLSFLSLSEDDKIITSTMINNYVKHGIVEPPVKKKYTRVHVAYFMVVCLMKKVYSLDEISKLIRIQIAAIPTDRAYDTFCEAFELSLTGINDEQAETHVDDNYIIDLFYKVVDSVVYKIYVQNELYEEITLEQEKKALEEKEKKEKKEKKKEKKQENE